MEKQSRFLLKNTFACFDDDDMTFVFGWTKLIMLQSKKSMFEMSWKWKDTIPCRTGFGFVLEHPDAVTLKSKR